MKKLLFILFVLIGSIAEAQNVKISDMTTYAGNPNGGWVPVVISGTNRKVDPSYFGYNKLDSIDVAQGTTYDTLWAYKNGAKAFYKLTRAGTLYTFSYGLTESGGTVKVDSAYLATRLRVQKQIDSLGALIGGAYSAGNGLLLTGTTFKIDTTHSATFTLSYGEGRRWIDSLAASGATIDNTAVSGFALLDMSDPDYVWAKRLVFAGSLSADSTDTEITITGNTFLSALTGDVDYTSSPPTSDNFHLGWNNSLSKWVARENAVIYPIMDGDSLRIVSGTDSSGGVYIDPGSAGCSTCWDHTTLNTLSATGKFGTASNHGIEIYTNNVKRAEYQSGGTFLFHGASAITNYGASYNDTINFEDAVRIGGVSPVTGLTGANAYLSITTASSSSAQSAIAVWSGASSSNPVFHVTAQGLVSAPVMASAWTQSVYRFNNATGTLSVGNLGGTTGGLINLTPLTVTSGTGSTTTAAVKIAGGYNTSSPNTNTGEWASLWLNSVFDQADAGTANTTSLRIEGQRNAAYNYASIRVLDSGNIVHNGAWYYNHTKAPATSGNYTVTLDDNFIYLNDLTTPAANRTVTMPTPLSDGMELVVKNASADPTYKWSFGGATVLDKDGSTVTTMTDETVYTLRYYYSNWHIIFKY